MRDIESVKVGGMEVYLLGTAHVSNESARQVEDAINKLNPDVVAVELCEKRYDALVNKKQWDNLEITDVVESGRIYLFLAQIFLSNFQRKIGDELGVKPGLEMLAAVNQAKKHDLKVELVDRDVQVTLKRASDQLSLREKIKLLSGFFENWMGGEELNQEVVEKLKEKDVLTEILEELGNEIPSIKKTLVDERDEYIAKRIAQIDGKKILAVLGAGHIQGVKKHLEDVGGNVYINYSYSAGFGSEQDGKLVEENVNAGGKTAKKIKAIGLIIPLLFLLIIGYSLVKHGGELTLDLLLKWFLINGTLSAFFASLVFAHPATVLTAFIAAPFTSLNPLIAAGWVAGYVEIRLRKPRVKDFEGLMQLNSFRDWTKNRVTKIILIVALANIGSSIGTFIALPYIASLI
jgi:pheromone shutdown-related protein TraB